MADDMVKELISAANVAMAGPSEVTSEQRRAAEKVFLDFQNMKSPFALCKHLFDTCPNDYVLFQTVALLKNAVIREWSFLSQEEVTSLISYIFNFLTTRTDLKNYVREQLAMVLAIMEKRSFVTERSSERENILNKVSMMIGSGEPSMQTLGCSILTALLNEYSSSFKSSDLGLNWETHMRAKKGFELTDMKKIFQFCVEGLCHLEKRPEITPDLIQLTHKMLSVCSKILMWNFQHVPISMPRRILGMIESIQIPPLRPPLSWSDMMLKSDIVHIFFKIHWKVRENQELSHLSLQCLVQLASLNGSVFKSHELEVNYVSTYLQNYLQYLTSCEILDHEALGISSIFWKLISANSKIIFSPLESFEAIREPFFKKTTELTCHFACKAATEEFISKDDQIFMEAYEQMLQGWSMTFLVSENLKRPISDENFIQMFNCYLKCHLSVPDGNRRQDMYDDCEEIDEIEEDDRLRYKLQLSIIGCFGRKILSHALPLLFKLIEERVCRLYGQLQRMMHMNVGDNAIMNMLCEDLHWLVMISGHVLTMESKGETAIIPSEINTYSYEQVNAGVNVKASLHVLGSPGQNVSEVLGSEQTTTDHTIRLIAAVFRLCEVEKRALEANLGCLLSPEVGTTVMWFLENFVLVYLLPVEALYTWISPALNESFGKDSEAGIWTVNFIVSKICSNLAHWNSEASLMEQTVACLFSLVQSSARSSAISKSHEIWQLMSKEASSELVKLQPQAKRLLYKSLNMMGIFSRDDNTFFTELFKPLYDEFQAITSRSDFNTACNDEGIKAFIMHFIEALIGITESFPINQNNPIWEFCIPVIDNMNKLMAIYHNNFQIVKLTLELYLCVVEIISYAQVEIKTSISEKYLEMLQIFGKHNTGLRTVEVNAEDEQFEHLMIIMKILTNLTTCEMINLFPSNAPQTSPNRSIAGPDLALFGLRIFLSLQIDELLKFPNFCSAYYKLIVLIAHLFPANIISLPTDVLAMILHTLELGLTTLSSTTTLPCFEIIADVASELFKLQPQSAQRNILQPFLKVIMNLVLYRQIETDNCASTSSVLFALICCYEQSYKEFVKEIIEQQKEVHHRKVLIQSFNALTADIGLNITRANKSKFRNNFDKQIIKIQGILCIK